MTVVSDPIPGPEFETPTEEKRIAAMYRGSGPRGATATDWGSFDAFVLDLARSRGARVLHRLVERVDRDGYLAGGRASCPAHGRETVDPVHVGLREQGHLELRHGEAHHQHEQGRGRGPPGHARERPRPAWRQHAQQTDEREQHDPDVARCLERIVAQHQRAKGDQAPARLAQPVDDFAVDLARVGPQALAVSL